MAQTEFRIANKLFKHCYPVYFSFYSGWKAVSDRRERAFFRQSVKRDMVVVDVGANIGVYTTFFCKLLGSSGRVHAFEPAETNFVHLEETVRRATNVSLNRAAVGDRSGTTMLYLSNEMNVDHRSFDSRDGRTGTKVPLVALDDYFPAGSRIDVIKIDVQGYELRVLKGAERVLRDNPHIIVLMEFWPYGLEKAATNPLEIIAFARAMGLSVKPLAKDAAIFEKLLSGSKGLGDYCNVILAHQNN